MHFINFGIITSELINTDEAS